MNPWSDPEIYYGCKRKVGADGEYLPDKEQPKVLKADWFVFYTYRNPITGKNKRFKVKGGINQFKTLKQKEAAARETQIEVDGGLRDGTINPFRELQPVESYSFIKALDQAWEAKQRSAVWQHDTPSSYKSAIKAFKDQVTKLGYHSFPIRDVTRSMVKQCLQKAQDESGFGNRRYNFIKTVISDLFVWMMEEDIIINNVAYKLRSKDKEPQRTFETFTKKEQKAIRDYLIEAHPALLVYAMFIYYSGVRGAELLRIKVSDLRLDKGLLHLPYERGRTYSKTRKERFAIIPPPLIDLIEETRHLENAEPDDYVFSIRAGLKPGFIRTSKNAPRELWDYYVKGKLEINKNMYGLKRTGADDKLESGIGLKDLQLIFGHESDTMTRTYTTVEQETAFKMVRTKIKEFGQ